MKHLSSNDRKKKCLILTSVENDRLLTCTFINKISTTSKFQRM